MATSSYGIGWGTPASSGFGIGGFSVNPTDRVGPTKWDYNNLVAPDKKNFYTTTKGTWSPGLGMVGAGQKIFDQASYDTALQEYKTLSDYKAGVAGVKPSFDLYTRTNWGDKWGPQVKAPSLGGSPYLRSLTRGNIGTAEGQAYLKSVFNPVYELYGIQGVNELLQRTTTQKDMSGGAGHGNSYTTRTWSLLEPTAKELPGGGYELSIAPEHRKSGFFRTMDKAAKIVVPAGLAFIGGAAIGGAMGLYGAGAGASGGAGAGGAAGTGTTAGTAAGTGTGIGMTAEAAMPAYASQINAARALQGLPALASAGANTGTTVDVVGGGNPTVNTTNNLVPGAGSNPELDYLKQYWDIGNKAINAYNEYRQGKQTNALFDQQRQAADPFGTQRAQYQQQLSQHMNDPDSFMESPIAKYSMNAAARKMASMGYNMSPAQSQAIADNAIKEYYNHADVLANLAGAGINPDAGAFTSNIQGQLQERSDRLGSYAALGRGIYDIWRGNSNTGQNTQDLSGYVQPFVKWFLD